jgi:replicative DNA helicase
MSHDGFVIEVEQNLIGAVLSGGDQRAALARISPDQIIEPAHRELWRLCHAAQEQYGSTNLPTVSKMVSPEFAKGFRDQSGESVAAYMARLMGATPFGTSTMRNAVKAQISQWARLSIASEAEAIIAAAADPATNPMDMIRLTAGRLDEIASHLRTGSRSNTRSTFAQAAQAALTASIEARQRKGLSGITTGLADLDYATGGLQRRDLVLLGARPSMGKTTLGTSLARHAAESGEGVGIFSLEMDSAKLGARMVSDLALKRNRRVPYQDMIAGRLSDQQEEWTAQALEAHAALPILIDDASNLSISEIRAKAETMMEDAEARGVTLGLLVVDHLGLVAPSARYKGNRNNEIGEVTSGLKAMAREYDMAVLLLSQLSRQVETRENKRPLLSDLRDSGNIEQDADAVMFLHREAYYLERAQPSDPDERIDWQGKLDACRNRGELAIAKQRNGPCNTIELHIDMACSAVRNAARY